MSNRSVATDALATLGTIIDAEQKRDAIHIAVEPVIAGERLNPGAHITVKDGVARETSVNKGLGIVDPFLPGPVNKGQRFWFLMYPRMVTSLRHVWAHPAFPDEVGTPAPAVKSESERWMRAWAVEHMGDDYYGEGGKRDPDDAYEYAIRAGHEHSVGPYESARDYIDNEWWAHWEAITGVKGERAEYFSCAC